MTILQKTLLICGVGVFLALAGKIFLDHPVFLSNAFFSALTASLPIPYPFHQKPFNQDPKIADSYTSPYDTGSTAWLMVTTICGFFLAPALVILYSRLYNLHYDFYKTVLIMVSMISFIWVVFR